MGLLSDALNQGLINMDEYDELSETWEDYGYNTRHFGDVFSLQKIVEDLAELGFADLAETAFQQYDEAITYYYTVNEGTIDWNSTAKRWYNTKNGQFVANPYDWIRD